MVHSRYIDRICIAAALLAVILTLGFLCGESLGLKPASSVPAYASRLFDDSRVHTVDIRMEDWQGFLETAGEEEYVPCTLTIDGEVFPQVGLRVKGNNSRRLTEEYGLERFSLKAEFDHYHGGSYHGLDKLSLDSSFQDNSYLKNDLAYDMMAFLGVPTPLTSYVWVTVNGEDWGLFLAVEEPEEAFARRNFGRDHGLLYKPDYKSLEAENPDVALRYVDRDPDSYDNIFRNAKFKVTREDQARLIQSLFVLSTGEDLETAVDVEEVLRYFVVQTFTVNLDSYLGRTGHNYFLYEEEGILQMIPWDYNLAFATYSLGMPDPVNDAALYVNWPIDTPGPWEVMKDRPLYHNLMLREENHQRYRALYDLFITEYFESGHFRRYVTETAAMIAPYVERDPTAFCSYEDHLLGVETITDFCLLRAESVRGQLEGTIPATSAGQSRDPSALVDPGDLWLPDLGEIADLKT